MQTHFLQLTKNELSRLLYLNGDGQTYFAVDIESLVPILSVDGLYDPHLTTPGVNLEFVSPWKEHNKMFQS